MVEFSTITYGKYTYRLMDEIPAELLSPVIGKCELHEVPPMYTYRCRASFQVRNHRLVMTELTCHLSEADAVNLRQVYGRQCVLEHRKGYARQGEDVTLIEYCAFTIKDLEAFIPFTGVFHANQIYLDEVEDGAWQAHPTQSSFSFQGGMLADDSHIQQDDTTYISSFIWSEDLEKATAFGRFSESDARARYYYVHPIGTVRQNDAVIAAVTWYLRCGWIDHRALDQMLLDRHPVLRTEIKAEASDTYLTRAYDLVEEIVKGLELAALQKLAPHIEYHRYDDYPKKLLAAVLNKANAAGKPPAVSVLQDTVDALVILQRSGLQDPDGASVMNCATEFQKLVSKRDAETAGIQALARDTFCEMTANEKVQSAIRTML